MKRLLTKSNTKRFIVYLILGIYIINNFSQFALYTGDTVNAANIQESNGTTTYAARIKENQTDHTNLIAILVDDQIYPNIKNDIQRYATKYIQGGNNNTNNAISNSKALVFPINTNTFSAKNIVQMLENIYFDGIKDKSSNLVGVILIGDIPLPVVNQNGYIFPTIYPYVDFEEQKFIWDDESKYFVYNDNPKGQAEIWHGIINFGNDINEYSNYFNKLSGYWNDPNGFVDKAIWYDDFIGNNEHFNNANLNFYQNNFIFSEDIGYHRYSNLMLKVLQGERNNEIADLMNDLNDAFEEGGVGLDMADSFAALGTLSNDMAVPTAQIKAMIDNGYLASYINLFSEKYLKTINNNAQTANRWIQTSTGISGTIYLDAIDTHYKTIETLDEIALRKNGGLEPFLIMVNNALEDIVDKKVDEEKYRMEEVLPLTYLKYNGVKKTQLFKDKCYRDEYEAYENFYFGENAKNIENAEQTSTYRGTYRDRQAVQAIDGITIQDVQNGAVPSTDISTIDLNKKSIGGSYEIFAQQVDANRGYNYSNSIKELAIYDQNKVSKKENRGVNCVSKFLGICWKRRRSITTSDDEAQCNLNDTEEQGGCETVDDFALRFWGGASSLNLTGDGNTDFQRRSGYYYSGAVYPVFDIAGSKNTKSAENDSTSFKAINTYAQLIQRKFSPNTDKKKFRSFNKNRKDPDPYGKGYDEGFDYDVNFTNQIPVFDENRISGWTGSMPLTGGQVDFFSKFTGENSTQYTKEKQGDIIKISKRDRGLLDDIKNVVDSAPGQIAVRLQNQNLNPISISIISSLLFPVPGSEILNSSVIFESAVLSKILNPCKGKGEIYTYKTIDSRVKNDSVNEDELNSSTYSIFKDHSSRVLKFYNGIMSHLSDLSGEINELFDPNTEDGALHMFSLINDNIISINSGLDDIINYDINTISGIQNNPSQISELAESWNNVFNDIIISELSGSIEQANESLVDMKGLLDEGTGIFDTTINYISAEKEKFKLNGRSLVFYSYWVIRSIPAQFTNWTTKNIPSQSISIRHKFLNQWPQSLNTIMSEYNNIQRITTGSIVQNLIDKKETINNLITATGDDFTGSIGCIDKFSVLCDTIDKIIRNYTIHSADINSGIYRINSYEVFDESNENDAGTRVHNILGNMLNTYYGLNNLGDSISIKGITDILSDISTSTNYDLTGVSEGINQTTSDRPIDSPRYLTFKGIAGNKVTFIYPDIYKAEVFSGNTANGTLQLMTPEEIANSIKKYLRDVATQYNAYLIRERNGSASYYNNNKEAFDLLGSLSPLASPNTIRQYGLFSGDYLINELETRIKNSPYFSGDILANEDPILFIANIIYYQNVSWPNKIIGTTILDDIDNQKANVDMNEKVSYAVKNYLTANNNRGKYLSPNYRDKGYEVAFINTNGNDNIDYEAVPDVVQGMQTFSNNYKAPTHYDDASELENELINECNIPTDEGVLLFDLSNGISSPRREAMECRWKKIKEKPLEIKVTFPFERDNSESFRENIFETFNPEEYKEIADLYATQLRFQNPQQRNQNIVENGGTQEEILRNILNYVEVDTTPKNIKADEAEGIINLSSSMSLGNIEMYMINIGKNKVKIEDENRQISQNITLGTNGFSTGSFAGNHAFDPISGKQIKFSINNPEEGLNVFVFYLCPRGTTDIQNKCVMYSLSINVIPGSIDKIDIKMTGNKVLEGADIPFIVNGVDKFGNNVGDLIIPKFDASVNYGTVTLDGNTSSNISFSNFDNTKFILHADESGENLDGKRINISISGSIGLETKVRATTGVNVVKGKLKVEKEGNTVSSVSLELPNRDYYSRDVNGIDQVNTGKLEKLNLELVDNNGNTLNLEGTVTIRSKNGILQPGKITKKDIPQNSSTGETIYLQQYKFTKSNYFDLSGGKAEVYFYPSFVAGDDTIVITMKGIEDIEIPVTVTHASPTVVQITTENSSLKKNSSTHANLKIYDNWDNPINESTKVSLASANDKISLSKSGIINITGGSLDFEIYSHEKGGKGYVYAYIDTEITPLNQQKPGSISLFLPKMMLPENNLNVMYLNLFGNDRGNQRGIMSNNNKYSENLIKNSDKLITVTTQLVSLDNIKHFPAIVDNKLHINNFDENPIYLTISGQQLVLKINGVGEILADKGSFSLSYINGANYENAQDIEENLGSEITNNTRNGNILYYISEQTDSIIESNEVRGNTIYINGNNVFDLRNGNFDKDLKIRLKGNNLAGYQIWEVSYQDTLIGEMILIVNNSNNLNINLVTSSTKYNTTNIWINGTTHDYGLGFYEIESKLPTGSFGYKSIQDSYDSELGIGFTSDFKNITNFGGGMSVGESTLPFGSELLINIGDPLLKRIDENKSAKIYDQSGELLEDTKFDKGLGQIIYSDPNKDILKVIDIDFNSDGLKDVIVIFKDGTIKILKNYGGTDPFQDLGPLSILADRISDVSVGDVDGNGYPDLIIWTESGLLRVYLNESGVFDVDGYPVCLNVNVDKGEISQDPEHVNNVHQIFLKDMDLDGALDIITNDNLGFIKIFYGGKTNGRSNYLSTNKYTCDTGRYDRLSSSSNGKPNTKLVYQFGVKIDNESHILDQSLVRRQGISQNELSNEEQDALIEQLGIDQNSLNVNDLNDVGNAVNSVLNFDVTTASSLYLGLNRLKDSSFDVTPIYEPDDAEIQYTEIGCLTGSDPVKIYKTYENVKNGEVDSTIINTTGALVNGDLVRVNVYIQANSAFIGTYIDNIAGPWMIPLSEEDPSKLKYFRFDSGHVENGKITTGQLENIYRNSHWDLDNARFMLDNINMEAGDSFMFSYGIVYNNNSIIDINIEDIAASDFKKYTTGQTAITMDRYLQKDNYPDITIQPEDGCNDSLFIFFNDKRSDNTARTYEFTYVNLGNVTEQYNDDSEQNKRDEENELMNGLTDAAENNDTQSVRSQLGGFAGITESIDWQGMLNAEGDISNAINIRSEVIDSDPLINEAMKKVEDAIGSLCNGIDLGKLGLGGGGGCGLPVPFNQAFLGPGKYHLFGCFNIEPLNNLIGDGMPLLNIPGNRTSPYGYIPAPGFFGYPFKGGTDSFSFGNDGGAYPSMFRIYLMPTLTAKIGIAMCFGPYTVGKLILDPIGDIGGNCIVFAISLPCPSLNGGNGDNQTPYVPKEYSMLKGCSNQNIPCYVASNESTSPFMLGSSSENSNTFVPAIPDGNFAGGIINIDKKPETSMSYRETSYNPNTNTIVLKGGADSQNKILGSMEQGLIQKIIKSRLDKQINYILTNLTNRKISVTRPDFSEIVGDIPSRSEISKSYKNLDIEQNKKNCENMKGNRDSSNNTCIDTEESLRIKCENRGKQRTPSNKTCVEKTSKNANDSAISDNDNRLQQKLISRDQISNWGDSLYANPFEQLKELFRDSPLINIHTKNIYVTVPMVTSDDITAYISLSQSWIDKQERILKDWQMFFSAILGYCGGSTDINGIEDIQRVFKELKAQAAESKACSIGGGNDDKVANIQKKLQAIEKLKNTYNFSSLGEYKIYESIDGGFYIYTQTPIEGEIIPYDVYLYYDTTTDELNMFTRGFDLIKQGGNNGEKIKLTIKPNEKIRSNDGLHIKEDEGETTCNSCANMFIDGTLEETLNNFIKMQSSVKAGIKTVKANIETLEQYKQFPLQLYEWIHATDKYIGDISNLISSTLGTLSMWMETNATRYSQYVDAIISIITTLETYQMILDLSADWSKSCSTCSNDNYDQFSCKLGLLCPDGILPIIEIPSTKLPSIYIDFSEVHLETDITLPNFKFTTKAINWPELPNLPSPPDVDLSMNIDEALSLGLDFIGNLFSKLKAINISFGAGNSLLDIIKNIPTIPSPPVLPDLPNFIPTVQMELPVLPPAPKIPELPNGIKAAIKVAKLIGKILCIVKGKIGLVAEQAVKAKVEQITQRDYEVKLRDSFDQTLSSRNNTLSTDISPSMAKIFSGFAQFLQSNKLKEANLKGFDISLKTHIDLQFNFNLFFELLEATVNQINKIMDDNVVTKAFNEMSSGYAEGINMLNEQMQACIDSPFSEACLGSGSELAQQYNQFKQQLEILDSGIHDGFEKLNTKLTEIENKKDELENLNYNGRKLSEELTNLDTNDPNNESKIEKLQQEINDNNNKITILQNEIDTINEEYGEFFDNFQELMRIYENIQNKIGKLEDDLIDSLQKKIDKWNIGSGSDINLQLSKELDLDIKNKAEENELQKTINKSNRNTNLQNLYKDVEGTIGYVDYSYEVNHNNFTILKDTLKEINKETTNKELKDKSQEYLTLVTMDREIKANTDSIKTIKNNYDSIINEYKSNTEQLSNEIINNYDKFLAEASNNSVSLVSDDSFNINLSTQLFDMKEDTLNRLLNQESITKKYMDYNMKNINGYLNAIENNSAKDLNMDDKTYNETKEYLNNIKELGDTIYSDAKAKNETSNNKPKDETVLVAQVSGGNGDGNGVGPTEGSNNNTVDIANYIEGYTINTEEGVFILANRDYINKFQGRYILTDINNDNEKDLILRDGHNVYVKYRSNNDIMDHRNLKYYQTYYSYNITSYDDLKNRSVDGFIKIGDTWVKLYDVYQEVKNFKYAGEDYDSIRVTRQNSEIIGDYVDGYLIKMIQRVDQFNDKENLMRHHEDLFDKKYILILPKGAELTGKKLEIDTNTTINNIEQEIGTGDSFEIFGINYYTNSIDKLDLTVDVPRHRQYSEIYSLELQNNTYKVSSSSSNQIVAGPQIIADDEGPDPTIRLYRPTTQEYTEGTNLEGYVGTHYILQTEREDNVALDRIWIANTNGETLTELTNINNKTGYIELTGLYFTGSELLQFYAGGEDINGNSYVTDIELIIQIPSIEVSDMIQGRNNFVNVGGSQILPDFGSPSLGINIGLNVSSTVTNTIRQNIMGESSNANKNLNQGNTSTTDTSTNDLYISVKATLEHDIDSGYVQFLNNRNGDIRNILTGNTNVSTFETTPGNKDIYGGYFTIGNNIGLFSTNGDKIATLNPTNGKITIEATNVEIVLDLSHNIPLIKVIHEGTPVFSIKYTSQELVNLDIANDITGITLDHENFGDFNGGTALLQNGIAVAYVSPIGQIYIPNDNEIILGEYRFDDNTNSVEYILKNSNGHIISTIKVKIKNLIDG